ncbi:hypothetical protein L6164_017112 [Bauhinia variegata]|uniref:Uncharacterized protein n=1 Tax=Bauhinia variegata TaxID=167791 RepID=A0ACB9N716_BAUVA|nr:hypothetical protein L6164_017112 [Bauhinia variegata]
MLPQLSTLHISCADQLKVIFRKSSEEGTSNGHEIVVLNLEELKLTKLPSFVSICPGLKLHAVKMVIDECPKFAPVTVAAQAFPCHCITEQILSVNKFEIIISSTDLVDFEILNEDYHYYDGFHTYDRYAAPETFQLSLQGYSPGGLESKIQELNAVGEFLRPNYDSENEERRGKNKRSVGKYRFSTKSQEELEAVDYTICPYGWFRAYFDVARTEEKSWASALLVNHEGKLIGARTRKLSTKFHLEQQALALELAIELARDVLPKSNICLEGDCQRFISILHDYLNDKMDSKVWYLVPILMDVREKLGSMGDWEAIEVLSKEDFLSSFFTKEEDDHNHDTE